MKKTALLILICCSRLAMAVLPYETKQLHEAIEKLDTKKVKIALQTVGELEAHEKDDLLFAARDTIYKMNKNCSVKLSPPDTCKLIFGIILAGAGTVFSSMFIMDALGLQDMQFDTDEEAIAIAIFSPSMLLGGAYLMYDGYTCSSSKAYIQREGKKIKRIIKETPVRQ